MKGYAFKLPPLDWHEDRIMSTLSGFLRSCGCNEGATVIEYAFIAGLISIAAVAGFKSIGTDLSGTFATVAASF